MNGMTHDDTSLFNYNYKPATEYLTSVKKYLTDGSKISTLDGSDLQKSAKVMILFDYSTSPSLSAVLCFPLYSV